MKRTLITTVLTVSIVASFEFSPLSAADIDRAGLGEATSIFDSGTDFTQLIARGQGGARGGGGRRGGGARRGGGVRRGGGRRSGGYRSGGGRRTSNVRRGGTARRTGGMRRSSGAHAQTRHASNGRSSHRNNARSNNRGGRANHSNGRSHSGYNGGYSGGAWWSTWDGADVPVDVVPYIPDVVPVVVDPRPAVITLLNPAETRATLTYNLGGGQYVLEAGQSMGHGEETQVIAFDRGGSFGEARYTLQPGTYRFVATEHGWDLHTVTEEIAADPNLSNEADTKVATETDPLKWLSGR